MKIRIDHIKHTPYELHVEQPFEVFPVLARMQADGECIFTGPVSADITIEREFDHLKAVGRLQGQEDARPYKQVLGLLRC